jgi:hypothetical protein
MSVDLTAADVWLQSRSARHRKRFGQWVTPWWVAQSVVSRACEGLPKRPTILDPACGDARWLIAAARQRPEAELIGIDTDPKAITAAKQTASSAGIEIDLRCADALAAPLPPADLIVGNPPFVRPQNLPKEVREDLWPRFSVATDKVDLYAIFVEHCLNAAARLAVVLPDTWMSLTSFAALRARIREAGVDGIYTLPKRVFPAAVNSHVLFCDPRDRRRSGILDRDGFRDLATLTLGREAWSAAEQLELDGPPLGDFVTIHMGVVCGDYARYVHEGRIYPEDQPTLRGRDIRRWRIAETDTFLRYLPRDMLQRKPYVAPKTAALFDRPEKIVVAGTTGREIRAAMDTRRRFPLDSCYVVLARSPDVDLQAVLGLLLSHESAAWYGARFHAPRVKGVELAQIPVPPTPWSEIAAAARAADDDALGRATSRAWGYEAIP